MRDEEGRGVAADPVAAQGLYERACADGHAWGCARLGDMLAKGRGVSRDEARAATLQRVGREDHPTLLQREIAHSAPDGRSL